MKKYTIIIIFLLLINIGFALNNDWFVKTTDAKLDFNMNIPYEVTKESNDYSINRFMINISGMPKNYQTKSNEEIQGQNIIVNIDTNQITNDLENTVTRQYEYNIQSTITNEIKNNNIAQKVTYPYSPTTIQDQSYYLQETEYIDSNNAEIKEFVNSLDLTDDAVTNIMLIAYWINNNIEYNLNSMTEQAQQKASWTLENKQAACDEITNLFIASLRALNIPAKAISGIAYTNTHNDFLPHAWSSVYIDDQWLSFDVTYGEYGYVDPGHIKLIEDNRIDKEFINYEWTAKDIDVQPSPIEYDVEIIESTIPETTSAFEDRKNINGVLITKDTKYTEVDIGSYNAVELTFENKNNAYTVIEMSVVTPNETSVLSGRQNLIVLKPKETLKRNIILKYDDDLHSSYLYTFPLDIEFNSNNYKNSFNENISVAVKYDSVSLLNIQSYIGDDNAIEVKDNKNIVSSSFTNPEYKVQNQCTLNQMTNNNYELECYLLNGIEHRNLNICLNNDCQQQSADKGQLIEYNFNIEYQPDIVYTLKINEDLCTNYLINKEDVDMQELFDKDISFDEDYVNLKVLLEPIEHKELTISNSCETINLNSPSNHTLKIKVNNLEQNDDVSGIREYNLQVTKSALYLEENVVVVTLYENNEIKEEQTIKIRYTNLSWLEKAILFFRRIFSF